MSAKKNALLIDTVSIQQYIFSSNKLQENLGASYIIEHVLYSVDFFKLTSVTYEIGYIGGGNALLFFDNSECRNKFISIYSKNVIQYLPGIKVAFGTIDDFDEVKYKLSMSNLVQSLIKDKTLNHKEVLPYKHGIIDDCPLSNEAAEKEYNKNIISLSSFVKYQYSEKVKKYINGNESIYSKLLNKKYQFPNAFEDLGQPNELGYIAIVHADGNGLGQRFANLDSLINVKNLSNAVKDLANDTMIRLVKDIINKIIPNFNDKNDFNPKSSKSQQTYLPIRPIIAGGDDITFVCEGKLGVYLAKCLIEIMTSQDVDGGKIDVCAGVLIVHTKFPFYKAYTLAEELCKQAKDVSRSNPGSYLSYLIASGGLSGSLDDIIDAQYKINNVSLIQPLLVSNSNTDTNTNTNSKSYAIPFKELLNQLKEFQIITSGGKRKWSLNKLMQLREVLFGTQNQQKNFVEELKTKKIELKIDDSSIPIIYNAIELIQFYPSFLLNDNSENKLKENAAI